MVASVKHSRRTHSKMFLEYFTHFFSHIGLWLAHGSGQYNQWIESYKEFRVEKRIFPLFLAFSRVKYHFSISIQFLSQFHPYYAVFFKDLGGYRQNNTECEQTWN